MSTEVTDRAVRGVRAMRPVAALLLLLPVLSALPQPVCAKQNRAPQTLVQTPAQMPTEYTIQIGRPVNPDSIICQILAAMKIEAQLVLVPASQKIAAAHPSFSVYEVCARLTVQGAPSKGEGPDFSAHCQAFVRRMGVSEGKVPLYSLALSLVLTETAGLGKNLGVVAIAKDGSEIKSLKGVHLEALGIGQYVIKTKGRAPIAFQASLVPGTEPSYPEPVSAPATPPRTQEGVTPPGAGGDEAFLRLMTKL